MVRHLLLLAALLLPAAAPAAAHSGPPYPLFVDQTVGPYRLSVWTDPDVGLGSFWIVPDEETAAPGRLLLRVRPSGARAPGESYEARLDPSSRRRQWVAQIPFDSEGEWQLRLIAEGDAGSGEIVRPVAVTPPGYGPGELLLYLAPFLLLGFIWWKALQRRRALEIATAGSANDHSGPAAGIE